jgi:predicted Na+-dependent transporter
MSHAVVQVLRVVLMVAIVLAAFATGLGAPAPGPRSLWRQPTQLIRALLAILVAVPLWAFVFLEIVPVSQVARSGIFLAVLAVGIGPVAGMKRLRGESPAVRRAFELNVTMLVASIVYVPVMVAVLAAIFHRSDLSLSVLMVAKIVTLRALIPLLVGLVVAREWPHVAQRISAPLGRGVNVLVGVLVVLIFAMTWRQLASVGVGGWLAAFVVATGAVLIGHFLGGPTLETRAPLAGASALRFPALGLLLASIAPLGKLLVPAVLVYIVAAIITLSVYGRIVERRARMQPARPERAAPPGAQPTPA